MTIDFAQMAASDGDRGYRYACMDAGMIGENLYLEAVARGLGVCGIGAFFDSLVAEGIRVDESKEAPIYFLTVGRLSR